MIISNKFKHILEFKQSKDLSELVPEFIFLPIDFLVNAKTTYDLVIQFIEKHKKVILRSALVNEGSEHLNSGCSLSIKDISNEAEFLKAYKKVVGQNNLDQIILQQQILHQFHYTGVIYDSFFYIENTLDSSEFAYFFENSFSGELSIDYILILDLIKKVKASHLILDKKNYIFEFGFYEKRVYIYQVCEISSKLSSLTLNHSFNKYLELLRSQSSQSLISLICNEFAAFKFRKKINCIKNHSDYKVEYLWKNWIFIFHYYNLFILKSNFNKKHLEKEQLWIAFIKSSTGHSKKHLFIGQQLSDHFLKFKTKFLEPIHQSQLIVLGFDESETEIDLSLDNECVILNFTAEYFELKPTEKVVLFKETHLLSHFFLQVIESNQKAILNIDPRNWTLLKTSSRIKIKKDPLSISLYTS